jgi:hypothetical protein
MVDMQIIAVTEEQSLALESLTKARERLEETHAQAVAANETMFEALLNNDEEEGDTEDRIAAADKNAECELAAKVAWRRYEKALIRYAWEVTICKKLGIIQ